MAHTQTSFTAKTASPASTGFQTEEPVFQVPLENGLLTIGAGNVPAQFAQFLRANRVRTWAFLSAGNPHSLALSSEANRLRHATLCALLEDEGYRYVTARSVDFDADIDAAVIFDIPAGRAEQIARAFAQSKFLFGDEAQASALACEALDFVI